MKRTDSTVLAIRMNTQHTSYTSASWISANVDKINDDLDTYCTETRVHNIIHKKLPSFIVNP